MRSAPPAQPGSAALQEHAAAAATFAGVGQHRALERGLRDARRQAQVRDVVEARFLAVAQALKLAPRVADGLSPSQRRIDLR